jgi:hypothetical protein
MKKKNSKQIIKEERIYLEKKKQKFIQRAM